MFRLFCIIIPLALCLLLLPRPASANGLPIVWQDSPSSMFVPAKDTKIEVRSEKLLFDFRGGVEEKREVTPNVQATYQLHNPGATEEPLEVAFYFLDRVSEMIVLWNNKVVPYEQVTGDLSLGFADDRKFPPSFGQDSRWLDPKSGELYKIRPNYSQGPHAILFPLTLPPGETGTLIVKFKQHRTGCDDCNRSSRPLLHYTYLLSPAKHWADFGDLEIKVIGLSDYYLASEPRLPKTGDINGDPVYERHFNRLPEGDLHISIRRHNYPWPWQATTAMLLLTAAACWWIDRRWRQEKKALRS